MRYCQDAALRVCGESAASISKACLLDFGFFVDHVLASDGIKFHDLHLVRHRALVLVCCKSIDALAFFSESYC